MALALPVPAQDCQVELIQHAVGTNWRQQNPQARDQVLALSESLIHSGPFSGKLVGISDLAGRLPAELLSASQRRLALSVTSRIWCERRLVGHIALMNLHPEGFSDLDELARGVSAVVHGRPGQLVRSGRYYHYYGHGLLSEQEWLDFVAQFLMPCTLVSPRYVGHSLIRRFCALRLNAVPPHKPETPLVVSAV